MGVHLGVYLQLPKAIPQKDAGLLMELTDIAIRRSKPSEKPYKLADGKGLYLLVNPSGGKLWRWKYRYQDKERLMALGAYREISLAEARSRHIEARRLLASGTDPMDARKAENKPPSGPPQIPLRH